jgi:UDP-GlcNAc:undecaprenyl-phosphate/decaprenyl-phosphate GlcNAc-1-phosphate transferase
VLNLNLYCLLAAMGLAFLLSLALTPLLRDLAGRVGLVDGPDGRRKHQQRPIPRAGGIAIFIATIGAIFGASQIGFKELNEQFQRTSLLWSLLGAAAVIVIVGLIDDYRGLRGRHKLIGQFCAVSVLVFSGDLSISEVSLFGQHLYVGAFGLVLTYAWMIGIINAINLIDGMDGLLGLIGAIVCMTLAVIAMYSGNLYAAVVAVALAGSIIGFLCFNLPPASVYLGDCGSMLIGLVVGALSIQGKLKGGAAMALAAPIAVLILPILDTTAAIARRKLTGRSIYTTDRGHLHHCLLSSGMNRSVVLILVGVFGLITSAGAVATIVLHNDLYAVAAALVVVVLLIATRLFGYAELVLAKEKVRALFLLLWNGNHSDRSHQTKVRLQGSVQWQGIWDDLTTAAMENNLRSLCLNVNAPALNEGYHAQWNRFSSAVSDEEASDWSADVPICLGGRVIGRLSAVGMFDVEPTWVKLQHLAEIVQRTEQQVELLTETHAVQSRAPAAVGAPSLIKTIGAAASAVVVIVVIAITLNSKP